MPTFMVGDHGMAQMPSPRVIRVGEPTPAPAGPSFGPVAGPRGGNPTGAARVGAPFADPGDHPLRNTSGQEPAPLLAQTIVRADPETQRAIIRGRGLQAWWQRLTGETV